MAVTSILLTVSALISVISLQGVLGGIVCENLPMEVCAFSVSSSGARCVLEKSILRDGNVQYECQSSDVIAEIIKEWIETEECMNACGVERMAVGMSTDALVDGRSTRKLCSPNCYNKCPNILELYFNLAAGEGIYLPRLCEAHRSGDRRMISEVISKSKSSLTAESFAVAPATIAFEDLKTYPASSPSAIAFGDLKISPVSSPSALGF
uniref:PAR1 protein n=1 Tax=Picea sitchensis TaxID=3332 RepID=A9P233_PICSI|nr:unknown [Picea sitchensis]